MLLQWFKVKLPLKDKRYIFLHFFTIKNLFFFGIVLGRVSKSTPEFGGFNDYDDHKPKPKSI